MSCASQYHCTDESETRDASLPCPWGSCFHAWSGRQPLKTVKKNSTGFKKNIENKTVSYCLHHIACTLKEKISTSVSCFCWSAQLFPFLTSIKIWRILNKNTVGRTISCYESWASPIKRQASDGAVNSQFPGSLLKCFLAAVWYLPRNYSVKSHVSWNRWCRKFPIFELNISDVPF